MMLGDGPMLEGHWYNPKTGDSFTVRDTFFEDNNIIVMTTDGRRLDYNIISKYVKTDKPMPKQKPAAQKQEIPQSILSQVLPTQNNPASSNAPTNNYDNLLTDEDRALLNEGTAVNPLEQVIVQPTQKAAEVVEDEDSMLIRRILKRATEPSIDCKISWKNFPVKQFEMLEMMAVDLEKITDYYLSKIDLETLRDVVKRGIYDYIDKMLTIQPQEEKIGNPVKEEITTAVEKTQVAKPKKTTAKSTKNTAKKK